MTSRTAMSPVPVIQPSSGFGPTTWSSTPRAPFPLSGEACVSRHGTKRLARKASALASSTKSGSRLLIGSQFTPRPGAQLGWTAVHRSEIRIDLGAIRHNARRLLEVLDGSELWAVVKANGYGHGAPEVGRAALE